MYIRDFSTANSCRDPESLDISTMLLDTKKHLTLQNVPSSYVEKRTHVKRFDVSCPGKNDILKGRKPRAPICPTYREIDIDVNRIPKKIVQRRCMCTNCLPIFDGSMGRRSFSRCVPTFQYQMVLRRVGCNNGVYEYKPVMEPFVVGCSCQVFFV
ncbi:interleukin 17-like protein [Saccostrea echinata]|uniref:interleukin 17-like protein n=1 Tax=Saccostrea echinata TaxID=191078 RepID=UPI002A8262A0|nr:interleukin 17-like protein [Saccostrea echinata]